MWYCSSCSFVMSQELSLSTRNFIKIKPPISVGYNKIRVGKGFVGILPKNEKNFPFGLPLLGTFF